MYHNSASQCSLCEGKEGAKKFIYQCVSCITGIGANMMLILFLALIAPSAFVSGQCDLGPPRINNFKYIKVGISQLTCLQ